MINLQTKYNELHLFIDESGCFSKKRDINIVGGVLLFGSYDDTVQSGIKNAMIDACRIAGEQYPPHFYELKDEKIFADNLSENFEIWRKNTGTAIYGVLIQHKEDVFDSASNIIAEQNFDNRYLAMIEEFIEYVVFVSNEINIRLTEDAEIHLHIAHRCFTVPRNDELKAKYESLGYKVDNYKRNSNAYLIKSSLLPSNITILFRQAVRQHWTTSQRKFAEIKLEQLNYNSGETTPAMYLADIVIGVERKRLQKMRVKQTLPILESLEYGKALNTEIRCKAYLVADNIEGLIGDLEKNPFNPDDLRNRNIVNVLVTAYGKNKKPFQTLYETAEKLVDNPSERDRAVMLSELLDVIAEESGCKDLLFQFYSLMVKFSFANHTGNFQKGNLIWAEWLKLEPLLPQVGLDYGVKFYTEFRLRRAVNLMDMFQYVEAETVLLDGVTKEEDYRTKTAAIFGCEPEQIDAIQIGKIYNTLGQSLAFQGNDLQWAENSFRYAIECFKDKDSIERSWVYLGHLACDHPNELRHLWDEVVTHLPSGEKPLEKPFVLALKLKAALVFYDDVTQNKWLNDALSVLDYCPGNIKRQHPWGLVIQTTALICVKLYQITKDEKLQTVANY
ncbi:MAG: hypothetical protein LBL62_12830, partial [Planctomycetaceae bacterium]|nr:hypothetical protein [Planctomycetaceae bacterium]